MARATKTLVGSGAILLGGALLLGLLFAVFETLKQPTAELSLGTWLVIGLGGIIVVRAQVFGSLLLFSLALEPLGAEARRNSQVTTEAAESSKIS